MYQRELAFTYRNPIFRHYCARLNHDDATNTTKEGRISGVPQSTTYQNATNVVSVGVVFQFELTGGKRMSYAGFTSWPLLVNSTLRCRTNLRNIRFRYDPWSSTFRQRQSVLADREVSLHSRRSRRRDTFVDLRPWHGRLER